MYKVQVFDNYPQSSLDMFNADSYQVAKDINEPNIILVRSHKLHDYPFSKNILAVGRAGTGVDNIPLNKLTTMGIPVFFSPGANANAVKELVLSAILLSYRNIHPALSFINEAKKKMANELHPYIEKQKKQFVGQEITGKTLGIIGLGNIGVRVANMAHALGMKVIAYDPLMTLSNALALTPDVRQVENIDQVYANSDVLTLHVPLNKHTDGMINYDALSKMKETSVLLNFSRAGIVDEKGLIKSLNENKIKSYITDFSSEALINHDKVICFPHLGASTIEAQHNASKMVINNLKNFIEFGDVKTSANFPETELLLPKDFKGFRLVISNHNKPGVIAEISNCISKSNVNIERMVNTSAGDIALNLVDITGAEADLNHLIKKIQSSEHIIHVRSINFD